MTDSAPLPPAPPAGLPAPATPDAPVLEQPTTAEPAAGAPAPATEPAGVPAPAPGALFRGTGRRKTSVARVRLMPGSGKLLINRREHASYFTELKDRAAVTAPLELTETAGRWDVLVNVAGGGRTGQAGAIRLGIARALVAANPGFEPKLREAGYLTRDARKVERKKYGHRKARRSFQFSKR